MHMKMTILRLLVQLLVACSLSHAALMRLMRDWPRDLDGIYDNSSVIVAGSVIQLFCSASGQFTAPYIQWTWNNITIPETAQLPHLMVNSWTENNTITSSVLTIYGFSTSDNGSYQCNACDNGSSDVSQSLLLTAINGSNVLRIIRELNNNIGPDRTSVPLGSSNISSSGSFLRCSAQQPPSSSLTAPSMIWLKDGTQLSGDGVRVVITTTNSTGTSNRTTSYVRIFNFRQSDAGVYQCVFYDTPSQGGEVITTRPYRVDTGPVTLKYLSPSSISLCPPEPLVIQVEAGGEYAGIQWTRTPITLNVSSDELVDFQQTFVRTVTAEDDCGLYIITLSTQRVNISVNASKHIMCSEPTATTPPSYATLDHMVPVYVSVGGALFTITVVISAVMIMIIRWRKKSKRLDIGTPGVCAQGGGPLGHSERSNHAAMDMTLVGSGGDEDNLEHNEGQCDEPQYDYSRIDTQHNHHLQLAVCNDSNDRSRILASCHEGVAFPMEGASPTVQTSGVDDDVVEYMNMPSQPVVLPSLSRPMVLSTQPSAWPEMDPNRALNSETGNYSYIGQFQCDDFDYTDLDIELEN